LSDVAVAVEQNRAKINRTTLKMAQIATINQFMSYNKANNSKPFGFNETYRNG